MKKVGRGRIFALVFGLFFSLFLFTGHAFADAPIADSFDLPLGYFGWNVYGGNPALFSQVFDGCVSGQCLSATSFQVPRIFKTGTPLHEGNVTFYAKAQRGWAQFGYGSITLLCTGAPNVPNPTNCEYKQGFAPFDGQWHQYLFAWRDHAGTKQICFQQDDIDVGHCAWNTASAHNAGDVIDTVALSGEFGARSDLGDLLMYDELATSNINTSAVSNVMFLPGIEASRLYRPGNNGGEDRLWEPFDNADATDLDLTPDGSSVREDVYTKAGDVIDELPNGANVYKSFIGQMDDLKTKRIIGDWEAIAYDWRLSLDDILNYGHEINGRIYYSGGLRATSTPYILQELRRLAENSQTGKVTIVAHSNGGLVVKRLIEILGPAEADNLIDNIIFVAVPQVGTPEAVGALLDGTKQSHGFGFVLSEATAREFAKNSPMAYNLLTSRAYFNGAGSEVRTPPVSFHSGNATKIFTDAYGQDIDTYAKLSSFISGAEGRTEPARSNVTYPQIGNTALLSAADALHSNLDSWTPPLGIKLYQIAGWGVETIGNITYRQGGFYHCLFYEPCLDEDLSIVVDGDGTVVTPSALSISTSSQNVSRYWMDLTTFPNTHSDILEVSDIRNFILSVISKTDISSSFISPSQPATVLPKRLRYYLHSPLTLELFDGQGNHLRIATSTGLLENTIPGAQYGQIGEVKYASVPANAGVNVIMRGESAGGFTLKIEEAQGNTVIATTTFAEIPNGTTTVATVTSDSVSPIDSSILSVDSDGNGTPDFSLLGKPDGVVTFNPLTVTAENKIVTLDSPIPAFTVNFSGFVGGDDAAHNDIAGLPICSTTATSTSGVGTYPITCTVGTLSSNTYQFTNFIAGTLTIIYQWNGFSQPINDVAYHPDQKMSVFKAGSTVPIKFQLKRADGSVVQASSNPLWLTQQKISPMSAAIDESIYSSTGTSGSEYRWDPTSQQYIYNWSTKGLMSGYWYKIFTQLDDGKTYSVTIGLR